MAKTILEMKESSAVVEHIQIMQNVINRMADQSAKCKNWCITLLVALIVLPLGVAYTECLKVIWICLGITVLFFVMDSYYLGIEREMRRKYRDFLEKLNNGCYIEKDLYTVETGGKSDNFCHQLYNTLSSMRSFSTIGFYVPIFLVLFIVFVRLFMSK